MKKNIFFLFFIILLALYYLKVVTPYTNDYGYLSFSCLPYEKFNLQYFFMTWAPYIIFWTLLIKNIKELKFLKIIIIPLSVYIIYFGGIFCFSVFSLKGFVTLLFLYTILIYFIVLFLSIYIGAYLDIKDVIKYYKENHHIQ